MRLCVSNFCLKALHVSFYKGSPLLFEKDSAEKLKKKIFWRAVYVYRKFCIICLYHHSQKANF